MADVVLPPSSQTATGSGIAQVIGSGTATVNVYAAPDIQPQALHQIPPPPRDFTGREEELRELEAALGISGATISGLHGMGGIGKTALALVLARQLTPRYPDAQFYLNLQGTSPTPVKAAEAMVHVIRAYHPTAKLPENEGELHGLYCSVLNDKRALLLMDNAADRAQVEPLIPPETCMLLVTSRQHFVLPGLHAKNLDVMPAEDAHTLLLRIAARIDGHAAEMARLCGYLPLALRVAASALAERADIAPGDYVRRLGDMTQRLRLTGVEASLAASYELLPDELRARWRRLAVFVGGFDRMAAAPVWAVEGEAAAEALSELVRYSLVEWDETTGRYRLHDLVRLFAGARLGEEERAEAQGRHAAYYKQVLSEANSLYLEGGYKLMRGLGLFDLEWPNIRAGQAWAKSHIGASGAVAAVCSEYAWKGDILGLRLHPREYILWLDSALTAARQIKDRQAEGAHLTHLGIAYADLGDALRASEFFEQALVIDREIGNRHGEGHNLGNLGLAYAALEDVRRAIELYEQQLVIVREIGDRRGEAYALGNLGNAYTALGDAEKAIQYHEQALFIARETGDRWWEGGTLVNLGQAYADLGEVRRAIEFFEQALVIEREIGYRRWEGNALGKLGIAYAELGDALRASEFFEQALVIDREIGDRRGEGIELNNLGNAYADLGETLRAIELYEQALIIRREIGDRRGEGTALGNMSLAQDKLGDRTQAIASAQAALEIFEQIEDTRADAVRKRLEEWGVGK